MAREAAADRVQDGLFVGPTKLARGAGIDAEALGAEEWIVRPAGPGLVLVGGRPRGTLYAAYRYLEDQIGVRWWNAFEESVPARSGPLPRAEARGSPRFSHRDVHVIDGPREFCARSRLNGTTTRLSEAFGGRVEVGPGQQPVHNFYYYVPPAEHFRRHPEYFSETDGVRMREGGQLCLSNPDVFDLVLRRLKKEIRRQARSPKGADPERRIFDVSPNDFGTWCRCARCAAEARRLGGASDQLLDFVNRLADAIRERHPRVVLTTLGYYPTFEPPERTRARDNVLVRFSGLQWRDFSKPLRDPANATVVDALQGWHRASPRLWAWDYGVSHGPYGDLPRPRLRILASDLRLYAEAGVEGMFVQEDYPVSSSMRDLEVWVLLKLLEDPGRDVDALVADFTDGYYGAAAREIRGYLALLEAQAAAAQRRIGMAPDLDDYAYLDLSFFDAAERIFDRALRLVVGDPPRERRVRHARVSLDRAALQRWADLLEEADVSGRSLPFESREVVARCRGAWTEQVQFRHTPPSWEEAKPDCAETVAEP